MIGQGGCCPELFLLGKCSGDGGLLLERMTPQERTGPGVDSESTDTPTPSIVPAGEGVRSARRERWTAPSRPAVVLKSGAPGCLFIIIKSLCWEIRIWLWYITQSRDTERIFSQEEYDFDQQWAQNKQPHLCITETEPRGTGQNELNGLNVD